MGYTAWGIAPDSSGNGTTPQTLRRSILAQYSSVGVLSGLNTGTTTGLNYSVTGGAAVCSRSASYGAVIAYEDGGTIATTAGPSSGKRYDVLYIFPNDVSQGDADNLTVIGIVKGTAASSPSVPAIPTGAVAIGTYLVPQGMTATSQATDAGLVNYAIPYSASLGVVATNKNTTSQSLALGFSDVYQSVSVYFPTDRQVQLEWKACFSANSTSTTARGSIYARFQIDGVDVPESASEMEFNNTYSTSRINARVNVTQGTHTIRVAYRQGWATFGPSFHYGTINGFSFPGRVLTVIDEGIAK